MSSPTTSDNKSFNPWLLGELAFLPLFLGYFLLYPRDTLSDFIVCSSLCFVILAFGHKVDLHKPEPKAVTKLDHIYIGSTAFLFFAAWFYGYHHEKVSLERALTSATITFTYFYYAWIQHFLAQRYAAQRLFEFVKKPNISERLPNWLSYELGAAILTGIGFGILHIPYPHLMLPSAIGGAIYAYYFLKTGRLWIVVLSHALVSSAWLYWLRDSIVFDEFPFLFLWIDKVV